MSEDQLVVQPAELVIGLELQGRYLQRFWPEWVDGRPLSDWSALSQDASWELDDFRDRLAAAETEPPVPPRVRHLQKEMLDKFVELSQRVFPAAHCRSSESLFGWLCRRLDGMSGSELEFPPAAIECLLDGHHLTWFVLRNRARCRPGEKRRAALPESVLRPEQETRDFGFRCTAVFVLWTASRILSDGLRLAESEEADSRKASSPGLVILARRLVGWLASCLARLLALRRGDAPAREAGAWEAVLPQMTEPARKALLKLTSRNAPSRTLWPELQRKLDTLQDPRSPPPVRLWDDTKDRLQRLSKFSRELLAPGGQPTIGPVDLDQVLAPRIVELYQNRDSICHQAGAGRQFEQTLSADVRAVEEQLLAMMTAPRPECFRQVLRWNRDAFLPGDRRDFTPSLHVRTVISVASNLLLLHCLVRQLAGQISAPAGEAALSGKDLAATANRVGQWLAAQCKTLSTAMASRGDVQVAYLALTNLRPMLSPPKQGSEISLWTEVVPGLPRQVGSAVLHLIGLCPLVHLAEPEVRPLLRREGIPARPSELLLDSPQSVSLCRHLLSALVKRALDDRAWFSGPLQRMILELLKSDKMVDNLLAVVFVDRLLDVVFGDVHRTSHLAERGSPRADESASRRFRKWMEDSWRVQTMLRLLTRLIGLRCAIASSEGPGHLADQFHKTWFRLSKCCTDGLSRRPWPSDLLQMLRRFLLELCEKTFRRLGVSARAFSTGEMELDEIERLGCLLFRDLVQDHALQIGQRQGLSPQLAATLLSECSGDKPAWLSRILRRDGPLQRALWIHGVLRRVAGSDTYELNEGMLEFSGGSRSA